MILRRPVIDLQSVRRTTFRSLGAVVLAASLVGCTSLGPTRVPADQFDYNRAIARSTQEQMLLNLVRVQYFDAPVFLTVGSVLTQYSWQAGAGVNGQKGFSVGGGLEAPSVVGGSLSAGYAERPTITYLPVEGRDFAARLMTPIPLDVVFALGEAGYPTDLLFRAGIDRINGVINLNSAGPADGGGADDDATSPEATLEAFRDLLHLTRHLLKQGSIEVQYRDGESGRRQRVLVISPATDPQTADELARFRAVLGLDPKVEVFRITNRRVGRAPDEITILTRSVYQMMAFLAQGVEVPADKRDRARAGGPVPADLPFHARWTDTDPGDAFVTVTYDGGWYSIANNDIESKRAFNILIQMFRLLAPDQAAAAPVLTLPAGP